MRERFQKGIEGCSLLRLVAGTGHHHESPVARVQGRFLREACLADSRFSGEHDDTSVTICRRLDRRADMLHIPLSPHQHSCR